MNAKLQIEVRDSLADVLPEQWNALSTDGNPFLRHEFLHTLDTTGCLGERTGWYPRYFLLWQGEGVDQALIGAVPAYIKTNSYGEFVFDWAWADAYERNQLEYYPKLVSSIPFTPATGRRLLTRPDQPFADTVKLLAAGVRQFANSEKLSSAHFLFLTEAESDVLSATVSSMGSETDRAGSEMNNGRHVGSAKETETETEGESGEIELQDLATDHLKRLDCQYHWHNEGYTHFDDFLSRCTAKRRKTIRRERRYVTDAGLHLEQRLGDSLNSKEWRWVHQFYCSTFDRKWGNPSLTRDFFERIGEILGERVLIVFAYDPQDESPDWPVACSIMFLSNTTLYGRFWGCRAEYNALHFEACYYQGIEYCITNQIKTFEPGAQGEHKITRGFVPTLTRSAHYIRHPQFRDAIANYLSQERPHVEQRCKGLTDLLPFRQEIVNI